MVGMTATRRILRKELDLDSNMCWAAACSNMIYWWLEQNAEYVRRYGYSGPSQYGNSIDSDVFELYRTFQ